MTGHRSFGAVPYGLWLVAVWVALWGSVSAANVLTGALVAVALVASFPRRGAPGVTPVRPLATVRLLAYFLRMLVEASLAVAWEVVTPTIRVNEGIVAVPVLGVSDPLVTVVANAVSLTPGTLTLEVDRHPTVLYVHVLHLSDPDSVRRDVQRLEELVIRAFGSDAAIARLAAGPSQKEDPSWTP